jgi:4-alpha-glucanotransferase
MALESQRHQARIIGENLGTVPPEVDQAMDAHGIGRLFVVQFEAQPFPEGAIREVPANSVASLNTHDTPPFASFWQGLDIDDRFDLGLIDDSERQRQRCERESLRNSLMQFLRSRGLLGDDEQQALAVLRACLVYLGRSDAECVLVNLEDLWLETGSQNTPGTSSERVNWRQRASYSIEQLDAIGAGQMLHAVQEARRRDGDP